MAGEHGLVNDWGRPAVVGPPPAGRGLRAPFAISFTLASVLLFVPGALRYLTGASSNALGLTLSCLLILGMAALSNSSVGNPYSRRMTYLSLIATALVGAHLVVAIYLPVVAQPFDAARILGSFAALVVCSIAAGVITQWLRDAPPAEVTRLSQVMIVILLLISVWCFVGLQPPSSTELVRPSFPFTEPSHFALVAAPFIMDAFVRASVAKRYLWLAVWLLLAYLNQSTSLIVVLMLTAFVGLSLPNAVIAGVVVVTVALQLDLQYYLDRLDFSTESGNLSALVYRQGWELMGAGLSYNRGWGIGFQQLGFAPLNVPTSDLIFRLLNDDANLRDGSFLAAKIISELGIFGFAIVGFCLYSGIRGAIVLRRMANLPAALQDGRMRLAASTLVAFQVEIFVRGIGYFSSTAVLFAAAALYIVVRSGPAAFNGPGDVAHG